MVIYPNPAKDGKFSIMLPGASDRVKISIYDNQGRLLFEKVSANTGKLDIDSGLKTGIYIVKAISEGMIITKKLIIQ